MTQEAEQGGRVMEWYHLDAEQQPQGPMNEQQLDTQIRLGRIHEDTLVWTEGMAEWQPASTTELATMISRLQMVRAQPMTAVPRIPRKPFFALLPSAFIYPFAKGGVTLLITGSIFFAMIKLAQFSMYGAAVAFFAAGYLSAYLFRIVNSTAAGEIGMPDWPSLSDWWEDIVVPYWQFLGCTALSFLPMVVYLGLGWKYGFTSMKTAVGLGVLGAFYIPMAIMAVAIRESIGAVSPHIVLPAIARVFPAYLAVCLLMGGLMMVGGVCNLLLSFVPFVGWVIQGFVMLILLAIQMRILGLLFWGYEERFGWLPEIPESEPPRFPPPSQ